MDEHCVDNATEVGSNPTLTTTFGISYNGIIRDSVLLNRKVSVRIRPAAPFFGCEVTIGCVAVDCKSTPSW